MKNLSDFGLEEKIIHIFSKLNEKYNFGESYVLSFHTDNYGGVAHYDSPLETSEDAGGYIVRMSKGTMLVIPKEAIDSFDSKNFVSVWGEKIYKSLRSTKIKR